MLYFLFSVLIVIADQALKYWITLNIEPGEIIDIIPGVIHLTYVENTGGAFSLLSEHTWILIAVSSVCMICVIIYMIKGRHTRLGMISLAAILGGGIGNAVDRIVLGFVVDMFEVEFVRYAIFNVADIFITLGCIFFAIYFLFIKDRKKYAKKKTASSAPPSIIDGTDADESLTEIKILEEYDIQRRLSESDSDEE